MEILNPKHKEPKVPTEKLRDEFLQGPADESLEKMEKDLMKVAIATQEPKYEKIVFHNNRDPGHPLEFHFSNEKVPFTMYKLEDGKSYTLPVDVIRNLERCKEEVHKWRTSSEGIPEVTVCGYRSHFICERTA